MIVLERISHDGSGSKSVSGLSLATYVEEVVSSVWFVRWKYNNPTEPVELPKDFDPASDTTLLATLTVRKDGQGFVTLVEPIMLLPEYAIAELSYALIRMRGLLREGQPEDWYVVRSINNDPSDPNYCQRMMCQALEV